MTYNTTLKKRLVHNDQSFRIIVGSKSHDRGIAAVAIDTAHDTLIVPKEENRQACDGIDSNQQRPLLEAARHVEPADAIHDGPRGE